MPCAVTAVVFHAAPSAVEIVPLAGDDAAVALAADLAALATAARFARADALRTGDAGALPDVLDRIHCAAADAVDDACGGFPGSDACVVAVPEGMGGLCGLLQGAAVSYVSCDSSGGQPLWLASHDGRPACGCPDAETAVKVAAGMAQPPVSRRRRNRAAATVTA